MTLLIIGLILSIIAISVLFYLNYKLNKEFDDKLSNTNKALITFQEEFSQYQILNEKMKRDDITSREIRFDRVAKCIKNNESAIYGLNEKHKDLPKLVGQIVSQVEFAQDKINRK